MTLYYNAPTPPEGMFDDFLSLTSLVKNVSTRSYLSLILSTVEASDGLRYVALRLLPFLNTLK